MTFALEIVSAVLIFLVLIYIRQVLFFYRGLNRLTAGSNTHQHGITVIIPARNEEQNIAQCLQSMINQDYPLDKFSIIVIDDQSTDRTADIVRSIAATSHVPIALYSSEVTSMIRSPKIRAMSIGIQHSMKEIIVTTDADCIVGPRWIATINSYFEKETGIVTGPTVYHNNGTQTTLFHGVQFLDFFSYTAIAAGAIGMGRVLVSLGSNMAFRIQAFDETGGFDTLTHINTGDDSLLAQKIVSSGKWKARFIFTDDSVVFTNPVNSWFDVLQQRMRWVGQTAYYPPYMMFFMICTFVLYILLIVMLPFSLIHWTMIPWIVVLAKFSADYVVMKKFTTMTQTEWSMKYFAATALIHIPFVLIATFGGYFFSFRWKDRTMTKES